MGGIAVGLMFLTQQQTKQTVRSKIDSDLAMARSEIISLMNNPAHCNANFKGLTAGTVTTPNAALTDLYSCPTTSPVTLCSASPSTGRVSKFKVIASGWPGNSTNLQGQISERVKISRIERIIAPSPGGAISANSASMKITFTIRPLGAPETVQVINFPVALITNASSVSGCPKSANSTLAY